MSWRRKGGRSWAHLRKLTGTGRSLPKTLKWATRPFSIASMNWAWNQFRNLSSRNSSLCKGFLWTCTLWLERWQRITHLFYSFLTLLRLISQDRLNLLKKLRIFVAHEIPFLMAYSLLMKMQTFSFEFIFHGPCIQTLYESSPRLLSPERFRRSKRCCNLRMSFLRTQGIQ